MLFGHQNDDNQPTDGTDQGVTPVGTPGVNPLAVDPDTGVSLPAVPEDLEAATPEPILAPAPDITPSHVPAPDPMPISNDPIVAPAKPSEDVLSTSASDDLLHLKQQALEQLSPLVGHLEQSPEERFRTTMMLIQSSDNQALIKTAYDAAQAITDDKARAQALLDIVNEINYFTQNNQAA
jgi:hypothetical protein